MNILHLDSSILGAQSVSRKISAAIVARLTNLNRDAHVVYRDLVANPIPHLTVHAVQALSSVADVKDEPVAEAALAIRVLEEVLAADIIVIGAPMYNFSIASQLKAWLDAIIVPGRTFEYSSAGVRGLLHNKRAIIASSRGGHYAPANEGQYAEFQESLLSQLLMFVGIEEIEIVRAEGVRMGEDHAVSAIETALHRAGTLELNTVLHADCASSVA